MMMNQTSRSSNEARNNVLAELVIWKIEELFTELGLSLRKSGRLFAGCCPIHEGDNPTALNIYPEGHSVPGYWVCQTHHCERIFRSTILGFVRGVLSHRELGWTNMRDTTKVYSYKDALDWLCRFVGQKYEELKIDPVKHERRKFSLAIDALKPEINIEKKGIPREVIRKHLIIPAKYYLQRGYSSDILDKYDIGLCNNPKKEMYNRVVVPVYDDTSGLMIGCLGRSTLPSCEKCKYYHLFGEACPVTYESQRNSSKWKNQHNFSTSHYLYNYWKARRHIQRSGSVILVEGPGDVWRLEEAGIQNSVAIFGVELSDEQQIILEMSSVMSIVVLLDNDVAGISATEKIRKDLSKSYKLYFPKLDYPDIGDTPIEKIRQDLLPIIQGIAKKI